MSTRVQIPVSAPTKRERFVRSFLRCTETDLNHSRRTVRESDTFGPAVGSCERTPAAVKPSSLSEKHHPRPAQRGEDNPFLCATEKRSRPTSAPFFHALAGDCLLGDSRSNRQFLHAGDRIRNRTSVISIVICFLHITDPVVARMRLQNII